MSEGIIPPEGVIDESELLQGGSRELDGDRVDIDVAFANFTPNVSPPEVDDSKQLGAILKGIDDALTGISGSSTRDVRNQTGFGILKGTLVRIVGYSVSEGMPLVDGADKDTTRGQAIGILIASVNNNSNGQAMAVGTIEGIDTSGHTIGDIVILGGGGFFTVRPAVAATITGIFQHIGVVSRVDGSDGAIEIDCSNVDGITGEQFGALGGTGTPTSANPFVTSDDTRVPSQSENDALLGTQGTPSSSNKFVTNQDPRIGPVLIVTATDDPTTTSLTDVLIPNMLITLGAGEDGDYLIEFSSSVENTNNGNTQEIVLYAGGTPTIVAESERRIENGAGQASPVHCIALVTGLVATDTIEVHWRTSGNTATAHERVLVARRVG